MVVSSKPKEEDVSRFVRWRRTAEGQWNGFLEFLYNKEEKSVLGRNAASWGMCLCKDCSKAFVCFIPISIGLMMEILVLNLSQIVSNFF